MHNIRELNIWKKAIDLVTKIYEATALFPLEEKYGLTSQMRRSAVSIASNVAEGAGRNSDKEFVHFLSMSNGSCYELETQLVIAQRLLLIRESEGILKDIYELQKMNFGLQEYLKSNMLREPEIVWYNSSDISNLNTQILNNIENNL
jgi:four helix bundle protein